MNWEEIRLVQETFAQLQPRAGQVTHLFYGRLFALEPELRPLFPQDMETHGAKFFASLQFIIHNLSQPETMITAVKQLGQRHAGYGVRREHYETVRLAWLQTVAESLGPAYMPAAAGAWEAFFLLISGLMKEAASQVDL